MKGLLEMNQKERERLKVIIRFEEGVLNQDITARQLNLSETAAKS